MIRQSKPTPYQLKNPGCFPNHMDKAREAFRKKMRETFWERFWKRVDKNGPNGCWNWIGSVNFDGYGQVKKEGVAFMCHRVSFEFFRGPIPPKLLALHHCDNPRCVNPDHLFAGTHKDNVLDCAKKSRRADVRGIKNPMAKLTDSQIEEIRQIFSNAGATRLELAAKFQIHKGHVDAILNGRRRSKA